MCTWHRGLLLDTSLWKCPLNRVNSSCKGFRRAPYVEHVFSDKLLERLLSAGLPQAFGNVARAEAISALERLDVKRLPHDVINDLANGVPAEEALARMLARGVPLPLLPLPPGEYDLLADKVEVSQGPGPQRPPGERGSGGEEAGGAPEQGVGGTAADSDGA